MQHREEKAEAATEKLGFQQHHGKRRGSVSRSDSRNIPSESGEWQTGTSAELPWTSWSPTLSRSLTPWQCLTGATSCFSSPAGGDNDEADMLSFRWTEPLRALHVEAEQSGAVELEGGRGSGSGERQAGKWASSRSICGISGQRHCACVLFYERERMSGRG
jgi:hypothetical protein